MPDVSLTSLTAADWALNAVVVLAAIGVVILLSPVLVVRDGRIGHGARRGVRHPRGGTRVVTPRGSSSLTR